MYHNNVFFFNAILIKRDLENITINNVFQTLECKRFYCQWKTTILHHHELQIAFTFYFAGEYRNTKVSIHALSFVMPLRGILTYKLWKIRLFALLQFSESAYRERNLWFSLIRYAGEWKSNNIIFNIEIAEKTADNYDRKGSFVGTSFASVSFFTDLCWIILLCKSSYWSLLRFHCCHWIKEKNIDKNSHTSC